MRKIVEIDPYFATGELSVQPVVLWANGKPCYEQFTKHAGVANDYFKTITPVPGHSIVYVLALGSWEFYGENRNGDGFPESAYNAHLNPPWIRDEDTLVRHYKSFNTAKNYRHHANKDPLKSVGDVLQSFWNPTMHRVELVVDLDNAKAPDLADRIAAGEFPPVSMGTRVPYDVCVTPDTLVRTANGYKEISQIQVGDCVRTHTGKTRRVKETFTRVAEDMLDVVASGVSHIKCTTMHPFYVLRKEDLRTCQGSANGQKCRHQITIDSNVCRRCGKTVPFKPEWSSAEDLHVGDYLLTPVDACPETCGVSQDAAYVLGMYVGDGSRIREAQANLAGERTQSGLSFSLGSEQLDIHKKLVESLNNLSENAAKTYTGSNGKKALAIAVYDEGLSHWATDHAGMFSRNKRLSEEVFSWSADAKKAFIGGYIDSDGCYDTEKGGVRITTINRGLAYDTQRVLHSLAVPASVSFGGSPTSFSGNTVDVWYVCIPAAAVGLFSGYSCKIKNPKECYASSQSFFFAGYWCTPIKSLTVIPGEHEVCNLSVEEDESYIAEGLAVHNCSVCGNRAPTRAQYCNHLKFQMRDVINGKKVAALNPSPRFFDISWVFRPADATAFMLKKVAHEYPYEVISGAAAGEYLDVMSQRKLAAQKLAVIDKVVRGVAVDSLPEGMPDAEYRNIVKMQPYAQMAGENAPEIAEEDLQKLSYYSIPEVVSTALHSHGIQMSVAEIVKLSAHKCGVRGNVSEHMLDNAAGVQSNVIDLLADEPQILDQLKKTGAFDVGPEYIRRETLSVFAPYIEKRAGIPEYLKRQLVPSDSRGAVPNTTLFSVTDPATGQRYQTTRGAAVKAHDEIAKRNLYKIVGGGALLGGAYKLLSSRVPAGGLARPALAMGLGAVGGFSLPSMGQHYMSDQGVPIPVSTEMAKMSAMVNPLIPTIGTLGIMAALAHDNHRRRNSMIPMGHPGLPAGRRALDSLGSFTSEHPLLSLVGGAAALSQVGKIPRLRSAMSAAEKVIGPPARGMYQGLRGKASRSIATEEGAKETAEALRHGVKISAILPDLVKTASSAVTLPEVDMDKLAMWLGYIIVEG